MSGAPDALVDFHTGEYPTTNCESGTGYFSALCATAAAHAGGELSPHVGIERHAELTTWARARTTDVFYDVGDVYDVVAACVEINSASGAPDNSSLSHFSAMTWPSWQGRAVRDRHRHAIEQAPRRWRGGRRERAVKF